MKSYLKKLTLSLFILCIGASSVNAEDCILKESGATVMLPIVKDISTVYQSKYGKTVCAEGGGAQAGIDNVISGVSDIGAVSRPLKDSEKAKLKHKIVALDALVFIVNSKSPIKSINKQQLSDIYTDKISNWKEINGVDSAIIPIERAKSGASDLFEKYFELSASTAGAPMKNGQITKKVILLNGNSDVVDLVNKNTSAIGYTTLGSALYYIGKGSQIKILLFNEIAATKENVLTKKYQIVTELSLAYKEETPAIKNFVDLFFTPEGKKIIELNQSIPVELK